MKAQLTAAPSASSGRVPTPLKPSRGGRTGRRRASPFRGRHGIAARTDFADPHQHTTTTTGRAPTPTASPAHLAAGREERGLRLCLVRVAGSGDGERMVVVTEGVQGLVGLAGAAAAFGQNQCGRRGHVYFLCTARPTVVPGLSRPPFSPAGASAFNRRILSVRTVRTVGSAAGGDPSHEDCVGCVVECGQGVDGFQVIGEWWNTDGGQCCVEVQAPPVRWLQGPGEARVGWLPVGLRMLFAAGRQLPVRIPVRGGFAGRGRDGLCAGETVGVEVQLTDRDLGQGALPGLHENLRGMDVVLLLASKSSGTLPAVEAV